MASGMSSTSSLPFIPRLPQFRQNSSRFLQKSATARRFIASVPPSEERPVQTHKAKVRKTIIIEPELKSKLDYYASYHNLPKAFEMRKIKPNSAAHLAYLQCIEKEKVSPTPVGILTRSSHSDNTVSVPNAFIGDRLAHALSEGMKYSKSLESVNLRGNHLSCTSSKKIIKRLPRTTIKTLDMSGNHLGEASIRSLMDVLESGNLVTLHLEGCQLTTADLAKLFQSATISKSLRELNLAKNNLGEQAGKLLGQFLMYSSSLRVLDIHWNCIRASGATQLFAGLKENSKLEALDLSWNVLDSHDVYGLSAAMANALELDDHLRHLDLSFNYLSKEQCTVIAKGLSENHTLLGLHIVGNYGNMDARGYLQPSDSCESEQANYFHRILSRIKPKGQMCWLCDQWVEIEFRYQGLATPPVFLHLEIDNFQPELMEQKKGQSCLKRVLPNNGLRFFFTSKNEVVISGTYQVVPVPLQTLEITFWPGCTQSVRIEKMQVVTGQGKPCTLEHNIDTEPRTPHPYRPPTVQKEKIPWSLPISLFMPYRFDTADLLTDCFEFDWKMSRCGKLVKDPVQAAAFKELLHNAYGHM